MEASKEGSPDVIAMYISSDDAEMVKQLKNIIQENLYSSRNSNLIDSLIDHYVNTKSLRLLELLLGVNESICVVGLS
jgi:Hamartin protein.